MHQRAAVALNSAPDAGHLFRPERRRELEIDRLPSRFYRPASRFTLTGPQRRS